MANTRAFCDEPGNEHAIVPAIVDVRDNLGNLAVHVLAARENLASLSYGEMIQKLHEITKGIHEAYDDERVRIDY